MDVTILVIFGFAYLGMFLGEFPGLALDRTGVALLAAIALLAVGKISPPEAWASIDVPFIGLTLALMVISAQFRLGGFYTWVAQSIAAARLRPAMLLGLLVVVVGGLSAVLANDIVCLAVTPILLEGCARRGLNPLPYLLALPAAANVGSAATLIGNPQNLLIGETLHLSFTGYLAEAAVPALVGLGIVWAVLVLRFAKNWHTQTSVPPIAATPLDRWQTVKGLAVMAAVMAAFLLTGWPRDVVGLAGAGVLLLSRRMASREILGQVDWHLFVLFIGLFIVNHALVKSGALLAAADGLQTFGLDPRQPGWMFVITVVLSNLVSNVPAVMLLLPLTQHPLAGPLLALASTLAGNLLIVGSIANIIVVEQAGRLGFRITWRDHARSGAPIALLTLAVAAGWLWLRSSSAG